MTLTSKIAMLRPTDIMSDAQYLSLADMHGQIAQLALAHPDRITVRTIGVSTSGRDVIAITLGNGPRTAAIVGGLHADEPAGTLAALTIARIFCQNPDLCAQNGYTVHIVPCADPDGLVLNEEWLNQPYGLYATLKSCYHPLAVSPMILKMLTSWLDDVRPDRLRVLGAGLFSGDEDGAMQALVAHAAKIGCESASLRLARFVQQDDSALRALVADMHEGARQLLRGKLASLSDCLLQDDPYVACLLASLDAQELSLFGAGHLLGAIRNAFDDARPGVARVLEDAFTQVDAWLRRFCQALEAATEYDIMPVGALVSELAQYALS